MRQHLKVTRVLGVAAVSLFSAQSYSADVRTDDLETKGASAVFSKEDLGVLFEPTKGSIQLASLSSHEMKATEGAVAPVVALGAMAGGRFIAQRWVTQRVAQQLVQRGGANVMAPSRSIANNIAGRNAIREFHTGPNGNYFTHFHTHNRNGSHVWYGRPR